MAQIGIKKTLTSVFLDKTGEVSGSGGLIGAVIKGYEYIPLKDFVNFEKEIYILVLDKISTVFNLPNRIEPNTIKKNSYIIDMYIGLVIDDFSNNEYQISNTRIAYIPSHYLISIETLPGIDCCNNI